VKARKFSVMDAFTAYGSESESEADDGPAPGGLQPRWAAADDSDNSDGSEGEGRGAEGAGSATEGEGREKRAQAELPAGDVAAKPKKRKLLDPFAAMSSAASLLTASKPTDDEGVEVFSAVTPGNAHTAPGGGAEARKEGESARRPGAPSAAAPGAIAPAPVAPAGAGLRHDGKKKEESVRQKNARKQKLGQANFTVKSNRECPDVWQGAS